MFDFLNIVRRQRTIQVYVIIETILNDWAYAKGWLKAEIAGRSGSD